MLEKSGTESEGRNDEGEDKERLMEVPVSYCEKWRREQSRKTSHYHDMEGQRELKSHKYVEA